jgi:pimeloyl-ACP methyl ester carboxylesterase/DNA-binding CsgD family transcriptional regulator
MGTETDGSATCATNDPSPLWHAGDVRQAVRFVSTKSGRVAYSVVGSGPPVLCLFGWVSHLGLLWEDPSHRQFIEQLARDFTVIRYDKLGVGLSDRSRSGFTLESELEVLSALIDHLGLRRLTLLGSCDGGQTAAAYAAAHPHAVSSLVIYGSTARGSDLAAEPVRKSLLSLVRAHWGLGSRVLSDIWFPDAPAESADRFARFQRSAATGDMAARLLEMFYQTDVTELLPSIAVPTLVLHRRGSRAVRFELGRQLAALIPDAHLSTLEGRRQPIYAENGEAAATAIRSFLAGDAAEPAEPAPPTEPTGHPLTGRERQVVALIAEGSSNPEIAKLLGVSVRTVDTHVEHVRTKLGLRARTQIAVWASQRAR